MSSRLITLIGLISLQVAAQSTPTAINFQSRLTTNDPIPQPVNGTKVMSFSIWDAVSGGTSLWSESALSVPVNDGSFSVILGTLTPIQASVFTGGASRYIQIVVEGDTLSPRQRLVTAPFAFMSEQAASGKAPFSAGVAGAQTGTLGGTVTNPATAPPGTYPAGVVGKYAGAGTSIGVYGEGTVGVLGSSGVSGDNGVIGYGRITGIEGQTDQAGGIAVLGDCKGACTSSGYAGSFTGNVSVNGTLTATSLSITNGLSAGGSLSVGVRLVNCPISTPIQNCACAPGETVISGGGYRAAGPDTIRASYPVATTIWQIICNNGATDVNCGGMNIICARLAP